MFVVDREDEEQCVARSRQVRQADTELFSLRPILINRRSHSYLDARTFEGVEHDTVEQVAVARMGTMMEMVVDVIENQR